MVGFSQKNNFLCHLIKRIKVADLFCAVVCPVKEMMYIWNGYTVIGKHKDLTENMLKTLDEAQTKLDSSPSMKNH